jgi:hypothetical protein
MMKALIIPGATAGFPAGIAPRVPNHNSRTPVPLHKAGVNV